MFCFLHAHDIQTSALDVASEMYASPRFLECSRRARDDLMLPVRSRLLRHPSAYKQCAADFPLTIHEVAPAVDTIRRLAFSCLGVEKGNLLPPIFSDHSSILSNIRWGRMQQSKSTDDLNVFPSSRTRELLPFLRTAPPTDHRVRTRSAVAATQASTRQYLMYNAQGLFCQEHDHGLFFAATALVPFCTEFMANFACLLRARF